MSDGATDQGGGASSDADLMAAYADGDLSAARSLTARHAPRVLAQAQRMLADRAEAEDVTQEAMLRLWRQAPSWRAEARVSTWLYRVVANLCTDRLRVRGRGVALEAVPEPEDGRPTAADDMQRRDRLKALSTALATLPERQAQAVALRHLEGLSNPEIARIMDIGVEAVESLTARGRRALSAALAARREELGFTDD
ncbi:RNA polymerase sigma factor [Histidinibacterium aquaticum]|uniref:RNA polymerase sigma factor n=1 Tax=Histidinibacterium aquaticum TaxID=2613962 RepID=A0A5J5GCL7_9RHOB|nr:RNA polymerase sigma factor [Histidinibacterium aquaticum]KAA9005708.1 RNA polymerase sigma factor [Histidinibacterium aquaticum]